MLRAGLESVQGWPSRGIVFFDQAEDASKLCRRNGRRGDVGAIFGESFVLSCEEEDFLKSSETYK